MSDPDVPSDRGTAPEDRPSDDASVREDHFEPGRPGSLAETTELIDEDGDDIRQYTGEPVETDEGWVLPRQQNAAGKDNLAGGGEWPDPNTAPSQSPAEDHEG